MQTRLKSFWGSAFLAVVLIVVFKLLHLDARNPFLSQLFANQDPPGIIALLVLGFTLFCLLRLIGWRLSTRRELRFIRWAQQVLKDPQAYQRANPNRVTDPLADIEGTFTRSFANSPLEQRVQFARKQLAGSASAEQKLSLISSHASIDDSHLQNAYGPMRALIWALPAFGFMGTAFEMAGAVGGLGTALSQTQDYNGLRNLLVNQVVPHLASAFNITIFALGCSVVCFILLSWVHAGEQTTLLEADALSLQMITHPHSRQFLPSLSTMPAIPSTLPAEIQALTQHIQVLNTTLTELQHNGVVGSLIPLVSDAKNTLEAIHQNLEQDIVISRSSRPQKSMGGLQL